MELQGDWDDGYAAVATELRRQLEKHSDSGAAVCIYRGERPVMDAWGGVRNRQGDPWERDSMALCYSTGKGVASTLLHMLIDEGRAGYDDPVAAHWPEFGQAGKQGISIRHVMSHATGLHRLGDWVDDMWKATDWELMVQGIERATPAFAPGTHNGYQAISYSWLAGELIQRIGKQPFGVQLRERLAEPMGLDGCYIGVPEDQLQRRALQTRPTIPNVRHLGTAMGLVSPLVQAATLNQVHLDDIRSGLLLPASRPFSFDAPEVARACIPSSNGVFTARSLARIYAMLRNGGSLGGTRFLRSETLDEALTVQQRRRDLVATAQMNWQLGFHSVPLGRRHAPGRFGHFGYGGRGAFADRQRGFSFAFVHNDHDGANPFGGARMRRLMREAARCAEADTDL